LTNKEDVIEVNATVVAARGNGMFEVKVEGRDDTIICKLGGKIKKHNIKITEGSYVKIHLSVYDLNKGRIVYRIS